MGMYSIFQKKPTWRYFCLTISQQTALILNAKSSNIKCEGRLGCEFEQKINSICLNIYCAIEFGTWNCFMYFSCHNQLAWGGGKKYKKISLDAEEES